MIAILVERVTSYFGHSATLRERAVDPALKPFHCPLERADAVCRAVDLIRGQPHWHVVGFDSVHGSIHAVHVSLIWRFVDDVKLHFDRADQGCVVNAQSKSRFTFLTLGRNTRNLRAIGKLLRAQLR